MPHLQKPTYAQKRPAWLLPVDAIICHMLEIGKSYYRHDPGGHITPVDVRTEQERAYQEGLLTKGYKYELLVPVTASVPVAE